MVTSTLRTRSRRLFVMLLGTLAILSTAGAMVLVPNASGEEVQTITFDWVPSEAAPVILPAPGHSAELGPQRGDVVSGTGVIYEHGQTDSGNPIGTFYFRGVGTADADIAASVANQMFLSARFELWGNGSIDVTGTVNVFGDSYLSITGGTGVYSMASGQCTDTSGEFFDVVTCEIH